MATFRKESNGFIYLYHWIDPSTPLKVYTKVKIDQNGWNKKKSRPRSIDASYNGINILTEMSRYEDALNEALSVSRTDNVHILKKELYNQLENDAKPVSRDFMSYFNAYVLLAKEEKKSNWKGYNTCLNHLTTYFKGKAVPFSAIDMKFYEDYS